MKRHQVFNLLITSATVVIGCRHTNNMYEISANKPILDNDNYIGFIDEKLDKMTFVMKKEEGEPPVNLRWALETLKENLEVDLFDKNLRESLLKATGWMETK